jgi:hypothetical protein
MKNWIGVIVLILLSSFPAIAQVSVLGNAGAAGNYCGWNAAQAFPVDVAHKGNYPINFQTNAIQRMTIMNTTGFVGINIAAPNQLLTVDAGNINTNFIV